MGVAFCGFVSTCTVQRRLGVISIAGLVLATSQLATTDLLERSYQPGQDFIFPKHKKIVV